MLTETINTLIQRAQDLRDETPNPYWLDAKWARESLIEGAVEDLPKGLEIVAYYQEGDRYPYVVDGYYHAIGTGEDGEDEKVRLTPMRTETWIADCSEECEAQAREAVRKFGHIAERFWYAFDRDWHESQDVFRRSLDTLRRDVAKARADLDSALTGNPPDSALRDLVEQAAKFRTLDEIMAELQVCNKGLEY